MNAGERFDRYIIRRLLGRGSMGEVYLAQDTDFNREVAVKIVYNGPEAEDRDILEAERLGAELQRRLAGVDPRVVIVHKHGEVNGDLFIEMEYIAGEDLSTVLARNPLTAPHAAFVTIELCAMLENLQSFTTTIDDKRFAGIVHGDLKPKNIRIAANGQIKVIDFGIAKALSHTRKQTMNLFASAAYCSPERLETQNMDAQSDLWSVGILLYQMLSGRLPFDEPSRERLERRIRSHQPPGPLPNSCPEPLSRIVFQMLAREPVGRYGSAAEAKADLLRWQSGQPVMARAFENDATVRTSPPTGTDPESTFQDRTVRTAPPPDQVPPPIRKSFIPRPMVGCFAIFLAVITLISAFTLMQWDVWHKSEQLKTDIVTEHLADEEAWQRLQTLQARMHMPGLLYPARTTLKRRLMASGDSVLQEYRTSDAPQIFLKNWNQARVAFTRALAIDPDDKEARGKLLVCEGQIDRINAAGVKGELRRKRLNSAVSHFREAADLLRKSPDAEMGLARIYTYELNDVERAEDALAKAEDKGQSPGKRERAQLADGYKLRADRMYRESRNFSHSPEREKEYLEKARKDYMKAQELYQKVDLFGDAARAEMAALQGQQRIEQRLDALHGAATPASVDPPQ
jgi:serine/threonine protein kinase